MPTSHTKNKLNQGMVIYAQLLPSSEFPEDHLPVLKVYIWFQKEEMSHTDKLPCCQFEDKSS